MSSATVWVKNNTNQSIRMRATKKVGSEETLVVVDFLREKTDRITGQIVDRGYTAISKDDYDVLYEGSKIFKSYVDKKDLVVFDTAPEDAYSDAQRIAMLETKISELENASGTSAELKKQIKDLTGKLSDAQKSLEDATVANAALKAEYEAYKSQFPAEETQAASGEAK